MKNWYSKLKVGIPILVIMIVLVLSSTVYAATYYLSQLVPTTVNVNPASGGGGGGDTPIAATIYTDVDCTEPLATLDPAYTVGGNHVYTCYVKDAEISTLGTPELSGDLTALTVTSALGDVVGIAREFIITISGGSAGSYSGTITFIGS